MTGSLLKIIDLKVFISLTQALSLETMISKVVAPKNCPTELDDIEHVNSFIDSLNDDDIKELIGDGLNKAPARPFKPIR